MALHDSVEVFWSVLCFVQICTCHKTPSCKLEFLRFSPRALVLQISREGFLCSETPCSYSINAVLKEHVQDAGGPNFYHQS
jgi:hypothetical protein